MDKIKKVKPAGRYLFFKKRNTLYITIYLSFKYKIKLKYKYNPVISI